MISDNIKQQLISLAQKYEQPDFINGDPSWFMHQVKGERNQETMAFIASCLSYGSRRQFMPKIALMANHSQGDIFLWVKEAAYHELIPNNDKCYYRLYTNAMITDMLDALRQMIVDHGSIAAFIAEKSNGSPARGGTRGITARNAIDAICAHFAAHGSRGIIPRNSSSACKRICMYLRWMVRSESPVDLGLWQDIIDRRNLIMPLDTHVIQQANRLQLIHTSTASMTTAQRLTDTLCEIWPDDPLKGDFALFGYGVNSK